MEKEDSRAFHLKAVIDEQLEGFLIAQEKIHKVSLTKK